MTVRAKATVVVQRIAVVVVLIALVVIANWSSVKNTSIRTRLHSYASDVRRTALPLTEKERLLDRIEALDDLLSNSAEIGAWRWAEHDHAISQVLQGGIDADKVRLIERELQRAEREIKRGMEADPDEQR